jgi:NADPH-dependent 2,4-dienoyl-CoA reductase/sulfur reductase-like enzyme
MTHLVIIGGSDAGVSAALRARELDPACDVTLVVADAYPNYSVCGLPYYHAREVREVTDLAHRTRAELERAGLRLLLDHWATRVDAPARRVAVRTPAGASLTLTYDELILATGARAVRPRLPGLDLPGVFTLHAIGDSLDLEAFLTACGPERAVIVGGGYIGLEMAEALTTRGLRVTLLSRSAPVLPTVSAPFGARIEQVLQEHGVTVRSGVSAQRIEPRGRALCVFGSDGAAYDAGVVLVAAGVQPNSELARAAGAGVDARGAVVVDRRMHTGVPHVWAAGDGVWTWQRLLSTYGYLPLGTTAHKQGRVAGENAVGGEREFPGSLGTQVLKVFDVVAARTGLLEPEARGGGFDPLSAELSACDHKAYYPGARELALGVLGDRISGRLLGAEILGPWGAEIAKRVDVFAAALHVGLSVAEVSDLDLSYTPPLGSPWDAVQQVAQAWETRRRSGEGQSAGPSAT